MFSNIVYLQFIYSIFNFYFFNLQNKIDGGITVV